jgi:hypothetical protein
MLLRLIGSSEFGAGTHHTRWVEQQLMPSLAVDAMGSGPTAMST